MTVKQNNIIYALLDPDTREVRYIGKSTSGLLRAKSHFSIMKLHKDNTYKGRWLRSLGKKPDICILAVSDNKEELNQLEIDYIALYRALGAPLTNLTSGGEGTPGNVLSAESRDKIRQKQLIRYAKIEGPIEAPNKKHHIIIDGIAYKNCCICKEDKILFEYGSYKSTWDGLNRCCKKCHKIRQQNYRKINPDPKLTKEEWLESYRNRDTRNLKYRK